MNAVKCGGKARFSTLTECKDNAILVKNQKKSAFFFIARMFFFCSVLIKVFLLSETLCFF